VDEVEHPRKEHRLRLEAGLMIGIGENKEDILQNGDEELLKEGIR
jgi:lipoate synthase